LTELGAWLLAFATLLAAYAIYWGLVLGRRDQGPDDWFLAGRGTSAWQYVLAGTAMSVTGWLALGHPSMVFQFGLPFSQTALAAICIPLAGILFLKRIWLLARRHGARTPAQLLGDYYQSELLRLFVLLVALTFAVPFVGMQLSACGLLIETLTQGQVDRHGAAWIVGFVTFVYVYLGGLRGVTGVGALQSLLALTAMAGLGCLAYWELDGPEAFARALSALGAKTPGANANLFELAGVVQFTAGLGRELPSGGPWTAAMVLSYGLALMGLQASPSFVMLGMSARDTRGFAPQQVWASATLVGFILLIFAVAEGLGGRLLASPGLSADQLHGHLLVRLAAGHPWLSALMAIGLIAIVQFTAAVCIWTTSAMLAQDFCRRYFAPRMGDRRLRAVARTVMAVLFIVALGAGTFTPLAQAQLGALALGFAVQLWPAWAGLTRIRWISTPAVNTGLGFGLLAVILTEGVGASIARFFGFELPWGRWPWTIHSAGWGLFVNLLFCFLISIVSREAPIHRRDLYHEDLAYHDAMTPRRHVMRAAVWALTLAWFFFALGPGAVLGNDLFGVATPTGAAGPGWSLGVPSLWLWQMVWWVLGVFLVWWLAYKMELATPPRTVVEVERDAKEAMRAYSARAERFSPASADR
jgi:SSS family solute:Na+ symporter